MSEQTYTIRPPEWYDNGHWLEAICGDIRLRASKTARMYQVCKRRANNEWEEVSLCTGGTEDSVPAAEAAYRKLVAEHLVEVKP